MVGIFSGLCTPHAGVAVALGIFAFECGSLTYNLYKVDERMRAKDMAWVWLWPRCGKGRLVSVAYSVCFSASNVIGGGLLAIAVRSLPTSPPPPLIRERRQPTDPPKHSNPPPRGGLNRALPPPPVPACRYG
jgi:hypothetical protein